MNLRLPNGNDIKLDNNLNKDERLQLVNGLLEEWQIYFIEHWNQSNVRVCLDILSGYICSSTIEKHKEDKYIMSRVKFKRMIKGNKKQVNFSNLDPQLKYLFGLMDKIDSQE